MSLVTSPLLLDTTGQSIAQAIQTLAGNTAHIGDLTNLQTDVKTDLVSALNEVVNNAIADGAAAHNAIYRGKYLGTSVTATQWAAIAAGTFHDLFIGDYWTINGVNWRIADFDYWYGYGDTTCSTHHIVIVPDTNLLNADGSTTHWMNSTDTTEGAYVGSDWYTGNNGNTGRTQVTTMINNAFGSAHILNHREYLSNAVTNGYESSGAWYDSTHEFMSEEMVYGTTEFKNVIHGTNWPNNYTIDHSQLNLFRHDHSRIRNGANWWLRSVASAIYFACLYWYGFAYAAGASSTWIGVRPAFGIRA